MQDNRLPEVRRLKISIRGLILLVALIINVYAHRLRKRTTE
jgi:hypothetical protein